MKAITEIPDYELYYYLEENRIFSDSTEGPYTKMELYGEVNRRMEKNNGVQGYKNLHMLYRWLQDRARYPLLNELIKVMLANSVYNVNGERVPDTFLATNMLPLIQLMSDDVKSCISNYKITKVPISKISREKIDTYVKEILVELDPTLEWLTLYQELKTKHHIIEYESLSEKEKEKYQCMEDIDGSINMTLEKNQEVYIVFTPKGTIEDVITILHELGHCFYYTKQHQLPPATLREFIPIFYEFYALDFLVRNNCCSKEEVQMLWESRLKDTVSIMQYDKTMYYYLELYYQNGKINEMQDIKARQQINQNVCQSLSLDLQRQLAENDPIFLNPIIMAHQNCDELTEQLIEYGNEWYNDYPYVMGSYLATQAIRKVKSDPTFLGFLKESIEQGEEFDPYQLFEKLDGITERYQILPTSQQLKAGLQKKKENFK